MNESNRAGDLNGRTAIDPHGEAVGEIDQVYLDHDLDEPLWVTVATGVLGLRPKFAPARGLTINEDGSVVLGVSSELIKASPDVEDDTRMTAAEQESLFTHFSEFFGLPAACRNPADDG